MPLVQRFDAVRRGVQQGTIPRVHGLQRITEICQQGKKQVRVAISHVSKLQSMQKVVNFLRVRQQRGNDDQSPAFLGDSFGKIEARQRSRRDHHRRNQIDDGHGQLRGADAPESTEQPDSPVMPSAQITGPVQRPSGDQRHDRQAAGINYDRPSTRAAAEAGAPRESRPYLLFQSGLTPVNQIIPDMRRSRCAPVALASQRGHLDSRPCHCDLRETGPPRQIFNAMPVSIARGKIHRGIHPGRIGVQGGFDHAHGLDKLTPVHRT